MSLYTKAVTSILGVIKPTATSRLSGNWLTRAYLGQDPQYRVIEFDIKNTNEQKSVPGVSDIACALLIKKNDSIRDGYHFDISVSSNCPRGSVHKVHITRHYLTHMENNPIKPRWMRMYDTHIITVAGGRVVSVVRNVHVNE